MVDSPFVTPKVPFIQPGSMAGSPTNTRSRLDGFSSRILLPLLDVVMTNYTTGDRRTPITDDFYVPR